MNECFRAGRALLGQVEGGRVLDGEEWRGGERSGSVAGLSEPELFSARAASFVAVEGC